MRYFKKVGAGMLLNIVRQDITKLSGNCVICHCISADAAMGAGVALALVRKYPDLKPTVQSVLKTTHSDTLVGHVVFYADSYSHTLVANMVTKQNYWDKSTTMPSGHYLKNLKECLENVRNVMDGLNEKKLAMPKIGCGLDRCNWGDVLQLIDEVFGNSDMEIAVCVL